MKTPKDILNWITGQEPAKIYVIHYSINAEGDPGFIRAFESDAESELLFMVCRESNGNFTIGTRENMPFFEQYVKWKKTNLDKVTLTRRFDLKQIYN